MIKQYTCPCCGYMVFSEQPGSDEICPICFWQDDVSQLRFPTTTGANKVSLIEAQRNFQKIGAVEERLREHVKPPTAEDQHDLDWRSIDLLVDRFDEPDKSATYFSRQPGVSREKTSSVDYGDSYPEDRTNLYYWKK